MARRGAERRGGSVPGPTLRGRLSRARLLLWAAFWTCSDAGPTGPPPDAPLDRFLASEHFDYSFAAGDTVTPEEARINDRAYEIIRDGLETDFSRRIEFLKFAGPDHIERLTGVRTEGGFVQGGRIFLTRTLDPHEIVHVIAIEELGRPSDFFDEGLAVNFGGLRVLPGGEVTLFPSALRNFDADREALSVFAGGRFPRSIRTILATSAFEAEPFEVSYPLAGSFVKFLLRTRGLTAVKAFFAASGVVDSQEEIEAGLQAAFEAPAAVLEAEWREAIGAPAAPGD
ncbi:MAG TPA: hypothetical protein VFP98_03560 [Candidatus Polarisedimenticolia bacterium]|nr:hypothetical protein [Candidatus Polarisedimenticolia bacterium]